MTTTSVNFDPYEALLTEFQQYLTGKSYRESTINLYTRCIGILINRMKVEKLSFLELDTAQALRLVGITEMPVRPGKNQIYTVYIVRHFIRFLSSQGIGKPPAPLTEKEISRAELRREYEHYLRFQRGLSEQSIFHSWRFADRFLEFRFEEEVGQLSQITLNDAANFLQYLASRRRPLRDKTASSHLRNFFRFLFQSGKIETNLASGIPSIAQRYDERLPRHLKPEQVEMLLKAIPTETAKGRRDYAMVLLLARLGLRPPEVIAIQLDDIDWRSGELIVRGKGKRHDRLPLLPDVGEVLANYIQYDRVTTERFLFVAAKPPHKPFKDSQILNTILGDAFAKSGLKPPVPYVGSHILRHSLATNLVRCGASLEEVSNMLRHRSRASTMIYAKLDLEGLRTIAPSWPVEGGVK